MSLEPSVIRLNAPASKFGASGARLFSSTFRLQGLAALFNLARMTDGTTDAQGLGSTPQSSSPTSWPITCPAHACSFFAALGNPVRMQILRMFLAGEVLSATDVAKKLGRDFDGVSKHLKVMRRAGVLCVLQKGDKRCAWYHLPKQCRGETGALNFGWCRISI